MATEPRRPGAVSDHNKALIRRFYDEAWNAGKVHVVLEIFADDYIRHDLRPTSPPPGAPGMRKIASDFPAEFLDLRMEVELMVAEDDLVAARWTSTGTNTGAWGGHPPTRVAGDLLGREHLPDPRRQGHRDLEPPGRPRAAATAGGRDLRGRGARGRCLVRVVDRARPDADSDIVPRIPILQRSVLRSPSAGPGEDHVATSS